MHKTLRRKHPYPRRILLDCYKLVKHLIGEGKYDGFKVCVEREILGTCFNRASVEIKARTRSKEILHELELSTH